MVKTQLDLQHINITYFIAKYFPLGAYWVRLGACPVRQSLPMHDEILSLKSLQISQCLLNCLKPKYWEIC